MEKDGIGPNYLSEDGKIMTRASHPLYLSYLTKLREWYEKGYIYKEFFVIKQPQIEDMVTAHRRHQHLVLPGRPALRVH